MYKLSFIGLKWSKSSEKYFEKFGEKYWSGIKKSGKNTGRV